MNMPASLEIAKRLFERKAPCSINTNLSLLNAKRLYQLKEANSNMMFLVSLPYFQEDLFKEITGRSNLRKILKNLENVIKEGFKPTINMVIHKLNKTLFINKENFL